jgi:serine/threonine-protein kinase
MVVLGLLALVIGVVVVGLFVSGLVGGSEKRAATPRPQPPPGASLHNTWKRSTDEKQMVYVPDGTFEMGSTQGHDDEQPLHAVTLDGFWIDRTEVTNSQYARCVADGACSPPGKLGSGTRDSYYGKDEFGHYPVINVTWDDSDTYCQWAGGRLPTEAEWEYAARGPDSLTFPWGNDLPDDTLLNYNENVGDTTQVGAYPGGASWVGAMDMAGNVGEWVADWYAEYPSEAQTNPKGPKTGDWRLMRGGSWDSKGEYVRAAYRNFGLPVIRLHRLGFRCVVEPGN